MLSKLSLLAATTYAADWNYATNGADWVNVNADCGLSNQSPIDLISYNPEKKDDFPYKKYDATDDMYTKSYSNQMGSIFTMTGYTTQVDLDTADGPNQFSSKLAEKLFGGVEDYTGMQFHFHAGSEHTIDGQRYDLEMHTVHYTAATLDSTPFAEQDAEIGAAAVGIIFSVADYTAKLTWAEQ